MGFSLNRIKNIGLVVYDLDAVLPFYEDLLESKAEIMAMGKLAVKALQTATDMVRVATLKTENAVLRLIEYDRSLPENDEALTSPICFEVDDIEDAYRKLNDRGIPYHAAPVEFSESQAPRERYKWAYFNDPEGNLLEIKEIRT
jgi:predicted enzyme related to lactoylglutathione lyase